MNVIAVLLTGSSDQKILSGFNYWLICGWFSWLISLFFDDLSPDRLCIMIVNMLRQASKPFLIHFLSLICSWFWFWFWLESVELMLFWQSPSCRGRQQPLHWSEARSGGPERRTETRMSSEQSSGTRNQDQDCLQMVHIPAGLRGAPENHRNVLSSRLPANVNAPATRLHRVLKDACTRLRAACRPELNRSRVQTVTERFWQLSVNQTRRCRRSLIVLIWDLWASQKPALTSGDRSIR